jgi:hypothetical protein
VISIPTSVLDHQAFEPLRRDQIEQCRAGDQIERSIERELKITREIDRLAAASGQLDSASASTIAKGWAEQDPLAAINWAASLATPASRASNNPATGHGRCYCRRLR